MRQVPRYLIIGNGRVARHFRHYFTLLDIPYLAWHRQHSLTELKPLIAQASHILLLISDLAIDDFATQYLSQSLSLKIHFSGSLISKYAYGAHPLMSFNSSLYSLEQYEAIPFVIDQNAPDFSELLPGLANANAKISFAQKAKYHALCVLSGNFSCMLWQKFIHSLEADFKLPQSFSYAYMRQLTQNLIEQPDMALSGPLVRNDQATIARNLEALEGDPFQAVYKSFINCYQELKVAT
ncbi:MAG: DUF2520 domain-containing protein [Gammaproteobacteria bacterium]|nr:DUF2520 domain-containing protein [Gammaproteobacteria bacterium]